MFEGIKRLRETWVASMKNEKETVIIERSRDELEFLPASIEIMETPPSPLARVMTVLLISIIPVALIWSMFSYVETEAEAEGRIIPAGKVKTVQSLEIGKVKQILAYDGQQVNQGDLLIVIDLTASEVDVKQVKDELQEAELGSLRLNSLFTAIKSNDLPDIQATLFSDFDVDINQLTRQQRILHHEYNHFNEMNQHLQEAEIQKQASVDAIRADTGGGDDYINDR